MTRHFTPPPPAACAPASIVVEALRCWRTARDNGQSTQPSLYRLLCRRGHDMLAPVFDSLFGLCDAALGRRLIAGVAMTVADDEHLLLGLLAGSESPGNHINCSEGAQAALDCAIRSTRNMMRI